MASVTRDNAVIAAGGVTTSVVTIAAELTGDFTTKLGSETFALMHAGEHWRTVS
jgi:hypothetical protein